MNATDLTFAIRSDLCIVARDPEMADMANIRGDIEGTAHYVVAEAQDGRRFAHDVTVYTTAHGSYTFNGEVERDPEDDCQTTILVDSKGRTLEMLERLASRLNDHHPALDSNHWTEIQACYGSDAYQRDGWEAELVAWERDAESSRV